MMKITKTILARTWWLGRETATVMGMAVMLAVVLGVGTTALAAVPGDPFKLGRINTIGGLTQLVGSTDSALLRIDNDSKGPGATALDLQVQPGKAPMKVNSGTKVSSLNADKLDGKGADEIGVNDLEMVIEESAFDSAGFKRINATCPAGKVVVATGYQIYDGGASSVAQVTDVVGVIPSSSSVEVTAIEEEPTSVNWGVDAYATCATGP